MTNIALGKNGKKLHLGSSVKAVEFTSDDLKNGYNPGCIAPMVKLANAGEVGTVTDIHTLGRGCTVQFKSGARWSYPVEVLEAVTKLPTYGEKYIIPESDRIARKFWNRTGLTVQVGNEKNSNTYLFAFEGKKDTAFLAALPDDLTAGVKKVEVDFAPYKALCQLVLDEEKALRPRVYGGLNFNDVKKYEAQITFSRYFLTLENPAEAPVGTLQYLKRVSAFLITQDRRKVGGKYVELAKSLAKQQGALTKLIAEAHRKAAKAGKGIEQECDLL